MIILIKNDIFINLIIVDVVIATINNITMTQIKIFLHVIPYTTL